VTEHPQTLESTAALLWENQIFVGCICNEHWRCQWQICVLLKFYHWKWHLLMQGDYYQQL